MYRPALFRRKLIFGGAESHRIAAACSHESLPPTTAYAALPIYPYHDWYHHRTRTSRQRHSPLLGPIKHLQPHPSSPHLTHEPAKPNRPPLVNSLQIRTSFPAHSSCSQTLTGTALISSVLIRQTGSKVEIQRAVILLSSDRETCRKKKKRRKYGKTFLSEQSY